MWAQEWQDRQFTHFTNWLGLLWSRSYCVQLMLCSAEADKDWTNGPKVCPGSASSFPTHSYTHTHPHRHADIHHMRPRHRDPAVWHQRPLGGGRRGCGKKRRRGAGVVLTQCARSLSLPLFLPVSILFSHSRFSPFVPVELKRLLSYSVLLIESVL